MRTHKTARPRTEQPKRPMAAVGRRAVAGARASMTAETGIGVAAFFAVNVLLAFAFRRLPGLAALHAGVVIAIGLGASIHRNDKILAAYVCAYIVGAEVLWRMVSAPLFWEFGKYAMVVVMGASILRSHRWDRRSRLRVLYIVCLLPSTLVYYEFGSTLAILKERLSFNLSGPLAIATAVLFFGRLNLNRAQTARLFVYSIGPILGIVALAASSMMRGEIQFLNASNFVASGGFGPNQVSAAMGLGVTLSFLYLCVARPSMAVKTLIVAGLAVCAIQSALTFSRTGLYLVAGSVAIAASYLWRIRELRGILSGLFLTGAAAAVFLVVPLLQQVTGGAAEARWTNTAGTGREELFFDDLAIWRKNWAIGVGPGNVPSSREDLSGTMVHTELSRLLAEHGMFGVGALLALGTVALANLRRRRDALTRGLAAAFIGWSFLYMSVSAMRTVAPAFVFGLASSGMAFVVPRGRSVLASRLPEEATLGPRAATRVRPVKVVPRIVPPPQSAF